MSHKTTDSVSAIIFSLQHSYKFKFPGTSFEGLFLSGMGLRKRSGNPPKNEEDPQYI